MSESSKPFPAPFRALLTRITDAVDNLDVEGAIELASEAVAWGHEHGNQEAADRAECNRLGFQVFQKADQGVAAKLQGLLMRSRRIGTRFLAAYNLSLLYDHRKQYDKSLFYARIAFEAAEKGDDPVRLLNCWNRIGNIQIIQCFFEEARTSYEQGLQLLDDGHQLLKLTLLDNYGYCLLMLDEHQRGLAKLFEARRLIRKLAMPQLEIRTGLRLAFCYAYIELDKLALARRHGTTALQQGTQYESPELVEKALYLLGEVEKKAGHEDAAYGYFQRLQDTFHPEQPELADLLMAVESHRLVNLRA